MEDKKLPVAVEVEAIRKAYVALNRNDVDGFMKDFDPQIERIEFLGSPSACTVNGFDEVKEYFTQARSTWAEGTCQPERFFVAGNNVVVLVHVRVRLKDNTDWIDGRSADVFTFREGKVVVFRSFFDEQEAREWAGVETDQRRG